MKTSRYLEKKLLFYIKFQVPSYTIYDDVFAKRMQPTSTEEEIVLN